MMTLYNYGNPNAEDVDLIDRKLFYLRDTDSSKEEEHSQAPRDPGLSILEIIKSENLKQKVFHINSNNQQEGQKCFQIKLIEIEDPNNNKTLVQIIDVTDNILYAKEKNHNMLLSLTNASVSHELRTPLNSISA